MLVALYLFYTLKDLSEYKANCEIKAGTLSGEALDSENHRRRTCRAEMQGCIEVEGIVR